MEGARRPGTIVLDLSDPRHPAFSTNLTSVAMLDPWESLSVNRKRGLLAAVYAGYALGGAFFDVYDVARDCREPKLLASVPINLLGHEGQWAPDGRTYYATGVAPGAITAIDVSDPASPRQIAAAYMNTSIHGLEVSADGSRVYLADIGPSLLTGVLSGEGLRDLPALPNGVTILDVSEIQRRTRTPQFRRVSTLKWTDGQVSQHAIPVTIGGRHRLINVDELGHGGPRIIDVTDERRPKTIAKLKTEIQMPENRRRAERSESFGRTPNPATPGDFLGYNSHYCNVDRRREPTILVCSTFESGMRVFDIRSPRRPREIAYFNPGGDGKVRPGSQRTGGVSGYTTARPRIIKDRREIWFTDVDKGFYVVRFTNHVWPFRNGHGD